tara:strand:+ start:240 stop:353 length:114 start_codon:yes stop_codon:yes gene_type:complete
MLFYLQEALDKKQPEIIKLRNKLVFIKKIRIFISEIA